MHLLHPQSGKRETKKNFYSFPPKTKKKNILTCPVVSNSLSFYAQPLERAYLHGFVVNERVDGPVARLVLGAVHLDAELGPPLRDGQGEDRVRSDAAERDRGEIGAALVRLREKVFVMDWSPPLWRTGYREAIGKGSLRSTRGLDWRHRFASNLLSTLWWQ